MFWSICCQTYNHSLTNILKYLFTSLSLANRQTSPKTFKNLIVKLNTKSECRKRHAVYLLLCMSFRYAQVSYVFLPFLCPTTVFMTTFNNSNKFFGSFGVRINGCWLYFEKLSAGPEAVRHHYFSFRAFEIDRVIVSSLLLFQAIKFLSYLS